MWEGWNEGEREVVMSLPIAGGDIGYLQVSSTGGDVRVQKKSQEVLPEIVLGRESVS